MIAILQWLNIQGLKSHIEERKKLLRRGIKAQQRFQSCKEIF
jgi:hypothetical protein